MHNPYLAIIIRIYVLYIPPGPLKGVSQFVPVKPTLHEQVLRLLQTYTKVVNIHHRVQWLIC